MSHTKPDYMPLWARRVLYALFVVGMILNPFVSLYMDEAFSQAFITATSIVGGFAGVTALAHPTTGGRHAA